MATKKELLAAQAFSRRRLLTAFVSGAPGGRELEPAKPLRGVVAGVALSVLIVAGSLVAGLFGSTLPDGWEQNSLVIVEADGSRYVARNGTLHPVYNTSSARLLAGESGFVVVTAGEDDLAGLARGSVTVGIEGAPDALPGTEHLVSTGWLACATADGGTATDLRTGRAAATATAGVLVVVEGQHYYVAGTNRHRVDEVSLNGVGLALGFDAASPVEVPATWINLFTEAQALSPLRLDREGETPSGPAADVPGLRIGQVVVLQDAQGSASGAYVLGDAGELVPLSDVGREMYVLGLSDHVLGDPMTLSFSEAQSLDIDTASTFVPVSWPQGKPTGLPPESRPCAQLDTTEAGRAVTLVPSEEAVPGPLARVQPGHGAVIAVDGRGESGGWALVDETGTLFPVPAASPEVIGLLGYAPEDVTPVPYFWTALFPVGPELTVQAAARGLPAGSS